MIPDLLDVSETESDEELEQLMADSKIKLVECREYYMSASKIYGMDECGVVPGDPKAVEAEAVRTVGEH